MPYPRMASFEPLKADHSRQLLERHQRELKGDPGGDTAFGQENLSSGNVQPGGSVRDEEVIQAANEHGMAMVFTSMRHFRH